MSEQEPLTYTVTPGPEILRKMGLSWTLFGSTGAHLATFSHGPEGEAPGPVDLTLSEELAAELKAAGYTVEPGGDAGSGIDPLGGPKSSGRTEDGAATMRAEPGFTVKASHAEGDVQVLDEVELHEISVSSAQADGSSAEAGKRRKN